ncbi:MAG: D-alanyl-D-alanine carboxypeptidase family protein [Sarcina sp.]
MKKIFDKILVIMIAIITIFSLSIPILTLADNELIKVEANSALLIEAKSGDVIFEKNSNVKYAPASVTKVMTMLLTMEAIDSGKISLNDKVTISENSKRMGGSSMLLDTGEIRTVEELIKGVGIASGNDAAVALAEYLGGSEENFVSMMNKRASELKMTNTQFKNCNGLPIEGHISTANDIAIMSRELLKHESILKYTSTYMETISEGRKSPIELVNHNKLVRFFKGCDGLKTGFTQEAKYCITATAKRDGTRMIAVIMGAPTFKIRNRDASMLMNYGFSKYETVKLVSKDEDVKIEYLDSANKKYFILKSNADLELTFLKGVKDKIEVEITVNENTNKIKRGDVVGKYTFYLKDKKIGEVDLYSDRDCKYTGFIGKIKKMFT